MLSFLVFVVGVLVVGGLLFLGASLLLGRAETRPPLELDRSPVELPDDRPVTGDDVRALRISVVLRGYRMTEVDWLLDQFAQALDERGTEIADLRARLRGTDRPGASGAAPGTGEPPAGEQPGGEHPAGEHPAGEHEAPAEQDTPVEEERHA